jgi:hypothetical protein
MKVKTHGNGFLRVYLSDTEMLHFYSDEIARQAINTDRHDHRWDFESTVLAGCLMQSIFMEEAGTDFEVYTVHPDEDILVPTGRFCNLYETMRMPIVAGESYKLDHGAIHRVWNEGPTITHMRRSEPKTDLVRVYVPAGDVPDNEFDNTVKAV